MGPPSHTPDPKSAWNPRVAPTVFTSVTEFVDAGSVLMGVFQMLFAGRTEHPPMTCCADAGDTMVSEKTATATLAPRRKIVDGLRNMTKKGASRVPLSRREVPRRARCLNC